jgi:Ca2+-binding RTX toxin-like protein
MTTNVRTTRRTLLLALLLAIAAPTTGASAATVVRQGDGTLVYTASAGAVKNHVGVQGSDDDSTITFYTSAGDAVSAPAGCTPSDLYGGDVVTCAMPTAVVVELGAGDDDASTSDGIPVPVTLSGGPGADWLEAADEPGVLDGGAGEDKLVGGKGDDVLRGGDGNDTIEGRDGGDRIDAGAGDDLLSPDGHEHANADVVDGGPGTDRIEGDYTSRFSDTDPPVAITFAGGADDGRPGEGDDLRSVEKVWLNVGGTFTGTDGPDEFRLSQVGTPSTMAGGGGDDRLRSGDGPDHLDGGAGNDSVDGGFGDDVLIGGPGRDTISGDLAGGDCGPLWCTSPYGNDTIESRDGEIDSITCGAGTDTVRADPQDVVASDCENVVRGSSGPAPASGSGTAPGASAKPTPGASAKRAAGKVALWGRPRLAKALRAGFTVRVSGAKAGQRVRLTATRAGRLMARGSATVPARTTAVTVRLRFTTAARKALKRKRKATLVVSVGTIRATVTLRR